MHAPTHALKFALVVWLVLFVAIVVKPIQKQQTQPQTVTQQNKTPTDSSQKAWDWHDSISPQTWSNWALVIVGIAASIYALLTLRAIRRQSDAIIRSERAWVVAELVPICAKSGGEWCRPSGTGSYVALSEDEILNGYHLRHKLRIKNTGRTGATILKFKLGHILLGTEATDIPAEDAIKDIEIFEFDHVLSGNESTEAMDADINKMVGNSIKAVGDSKKIIGFSGLVEYQTVFSDTEVQKARFRYVYIPSTQRLDRVALPKSYEGKKRQV